MPNPQIENNFKYHAPKAGQPEIYEEIRNKAKELAELIDEVTPKSREQSLAMTNLEQAVFWANAAVARNE
ncbi:Acb2/Tad1 domain-containing protein [Paenibacillus sp. FSL H7-0714]|uniref:Acb2/Tad1 domain-containing protein n=1 Tax=Paenibacillus sp. FSL H7-0714 TaxID=2954735 RepID=UPI0030FB61C4